MWVLWVLSTHRFQGKSTLISSFLVKTGCSLGKMGSQHPQFSKPNKGPDLNMFCDHTMYFLFIINNKLYFSTGLSVLMAPMLSNIPMPVLFGLFLFMGVASLNGLQMFDRLCLFFMPKKYQPDLTYLRTVPLTRVNLFTIIQLFSFIVLWIVKEVKDISIIFPIMVNIIMLFYIGRNLMGTAI